MDARLHWQVDQRDDDIAPVAIAEQRAPRRAHPGRAITPGLVGLYLMALLVAGGVGFWLGRWSEVLSVAQHQIERLVALETIAWRDGEVELLTSTLDPTAPEGWRSSLVSAFERDAPNRHYAAEVATLRLRSPGRAEVTVRVTTDQGRHEEQRHYRLDGGSWYWTP